MNLRQVSLRAISSVVTQDDRPEYPYVKHRVDGRTLDRDPLDQVGHTTGKHTGRDACLHGRPRNYLQVASRGIDSNDLQALSEKKQSVSTLPTACINDGPRLVHISPVVPGEESRSPRWRELC